MQTVSNILQGNPFSTPVGQLVERATDGAQSGEDWALLMAVCDAVNELEEGPRDALRALRRRLTTSAGRSNSAVQYSLSVLETCVKNCGFRFHLLVAKRDFLDELVRLISPKNEPPQQIQDRVLGLLQAWSDAFRGRPELREVERLVEELRSKGVEFPMTDLDSMAPINTPARSAASAAAASTNHDSIAVLPSNDFGADSGPVSPNRRPQQQSKQQQQHHSTQPHQQHQQVSGQRSRPIATPSPEQLAKLRSELDIVLGNVKVFNEMLNELSPDSVQPEDLSLLQELNRTNRQMQQRIVELVDVIANDEVVGELLRINDDLNNGFLRFDRFERYREANRQPQVQQQQQQPSFNPMFNRPDALQQPPPVPASSQPPEPQAAPLIDFSTPDEPKPSSIGQQLAGLQITQAGSQSVQQQQPLEQSDEFDMFASSRQAFDRNRAGMSGAAAYAGATDGGQQLATGLQNGLAQRTGIATAGGAASQTATSGVSSSDFNLFLQQQQQQNYTSAGTAASSSDRSRTLKHRDDQPEDTLFAL